MRDGDEQAFARLVSEHQDSLHRVARKYIRDSEAAQEVVQETWLGFLHSLDRFEGRCSIKTWLFRILMNKAKSRGCREQRTVPFSALAAQEASDSFSSVSPEHFIDAEGSAHHGHWLNAPGAWKRDPESDLLDGELRGIIEHAIEQLPKAQGIVILLRDVNGFTAEEVCQTLGVSHGNQRVLLHRARAKVRAIIAAPLALEG